MKTKFILFTFLLSLCNYSYAQWTKLTTASYPGVDLTGIYANGSTIIATGFAFSNFQGMILKSFNDGASWDTTLVPPSGFLFKTIAFRNADTGFIAGYGSTTIWLRTTDGGHTWAYSNQDALNSGINDMHFITDKVGVASGYGYDQFTTGQCYRTYDGGDTWLAIDSAKLGCLDTLPMDYVQFLDAKTGYGHADFLGHKSIMKTTDSGQSWQLQYQHNTIIVGVHFWNVNNGIFVDVQGDVYKTTNAGQSWLKTANKVPGSSIFMSMAFMNQSTGVLVGAAGDIYKTTDGGETWTAEPKIINATLMRARFYNNRAYVSARDGHILRSDILPNNVNQVLPLKEQLNVYPNPAKDVLNISSYQAAYKNIKVIMTDMKGAVITQAATSDGLLQLSTTGIAPGTYLLQVNADDRTTSFKISITH